ncbi:amidohydrolase family protein [Paraburkholderia xenovorans]|jgi:aminocarboxymuconate-semialdehyde decarboxylase
MDEISLDVHAHLIPVHPDAPARFDGVQWEASSRRMTIDGHVIGMTALFDDKALLNWMDKHRIARAWISVPPPAYRAHLAEPEALRWASHLNEGLHEIATRSGARLQALLHLPLEHPDVALAVIASRRLDDPVVAGYAASTTIRGGTLADDALRPVWKVLHAQRAFLFLHPGDCADPRLDRFYLQNLLGNPQETAVAVAALVFGGVLERYPDIQICLAHGGGTVPAVAGRWQRGFDTARPGVRLDAQAPHAALQRLWVDCITHDTAALQCACATFGTERVLFGSDWPFPMGITDPEQQCAMLPEPTRRRVFSENVRALLFQTR